MSIEMQRVADYIVNKVSALHKDVLTLEEVAQYTGLSRSYLYKLVESRAIPHYKPNGKHLYFERKEVESWLRRNRIASSDEITSKAAGYCHNNR